MPATKLAFSAQPALASTTPTFLDGPPADELEQRVSEKITERARQIFELSGGAPGNDEANWLQAEAEVLRGVPQIRESGTWLALGASIPEASAQGMQIVVRPRRVLVRATAKSEQESAGDAERQAQEIFLAANLKVEVDPPSAAASFRDNRLNLMVRKRRPDNLTGRPENASH
jgi:HSP20 family molecular chaperone IbpA